MAEAFVQLPTDGSGKKADCGPAPLDDGAGNFVYRQVVTLGDPSAIAARATVKAGGVAPLSSDGALVVVLRDVAEPGGAAITGAAMPSGGVGLTGWLSAIWKALTGTINVSTVSANPSAIYVRQFAPGIGSGGLAASLPAQALTNGVVLKAMSSNTNTVFIGMSNAVTNQIGANPGYPLVKGESISVAVTNLNAVYAIANNVGDALAIIGN